MSATPLGVIIGSVIGGAATERKPLPLDKALQLELERQGFHVTQIYRHGPNRLRVLISQHESFWTLDSRAPTNSQMSADDIDDWLYGDLIDFQLKLVAGEAAC